jgi:protein-tyrosine phosphatase
MPHKTSLIKITIAVLSFVLMTHAFATSSEVVKFKTSEVNGKGPLPYNYRIIDSHIHAGGHPLNPSTTFMNSNEQVLAILNYLKSKGVKTIVDLENSWWIQWRYKSLLKKAGINRIHIPMHSNKVPTKEEWNKIKETMKGPVYIHCKWGADRAGSIVAKYLVEVKGYKPKDAWKAVISGGTHAGPIGGLKKKKSYRKIVLFFWPNGESDADFRKAYN